MRRGERRTNALGPVALLLASCGGESDPVVQGTPDASTAGEYRNAVVVDVAEKFLMSSDHGWDGVVWADKVGFSIGGVPVHSLDAADVAAGLEGCPPRAAEVEGRPCPVSVRDVLAGASDEVVELRAPDRVGCNRFTGPAVQDGLAAVSIRPPSTERDCFSDLAETLYVGGGGEVAWVDLTLSGP